MRYKRLRCCCCGEGCLGHQWWNRDTGYGLCPSCARDPRVNSEDGKIVEVGETHRSYGVRGYHYDVEEK